jgi:preprotein translocase subunit SecA
MRHHERMIMLSVLDGLWKDHLLAMDQLKEGIGLRGYGQQDPLIEYKRESFEAFEVMMTRFQEDTVRILYRMQIVGPDGKEIAVPSRPQPQRMVLQGGSATAAEPASSAPEIPVRAPMRSPATTIDAIEQEFQRKKQRELQQARMAGGGKSSAPAEQRRAGHKVGRNDPCPCGSGKKYKKCHGVEAH